MTYELCLSDYSLCVDRIYIRRAAAGAGSRTFALVKAHLNLCLRRKTPVSTLSDGD